jgi:hypothetical protein
MIGFHAQNQMNLGSLTNLILLRVASRSDIAVEQDLGRCGCGRCVN